jgi:hypothetical protein
MRSQSDRVRRAARVIGLAGIALSATALTVADRRAIRADGVPPVLTYREAEDPVERILAAARHQLDSDEGNNQEAANRSLRDLNQTILTRPGDPRPHWYRGLTFSFLKRNAEARAARDQAIRLARLWPGGGDLLLRYYGLHSYYCGLEHDPLAAAAAYLAVLDLRLAGPEEYSKFAETLCGPAQRDALAPEPWPDASDLERLEARWGPLTQFFERHASPADAAALERVPKLVQPGMSYRDVVRKVGLPSLDLGFCHWDHGVPSMQTCWRYEIEQPTIVREGRFVGAIPPQNAVIVHVVILDGMVQKVERLFSSSPQERPYGHGERVSFPYEQDSIESVAFSPGGALIAAGDLLGDVHLREVRGGREWSVLRVPGLEKDGSAGSCTFVAFAPNGKILAAAGLYDGTVRLWDVASGRLHATLEVFPVAKDSRLMHHVQSLAFAPDGKTLATAGHGPEVRLWDVATGRLLAALRGHSHEARIVAFSPDGKTLASGGDEGMVCLWDVATGRPRSRLPGYEAAVSALAFTPDGRTLAVGRSDGNDACVRLRDLTTNRWRARLRVGPSLSPISVAFAPDGKTLAVADNFWRVATLWDTTSGRRIGTLEGHRWRVEAVAYSPDGKTIATGGSGALKLWDAPAPIDSKAIMYLKLAIIMGLCSGFVAGIAWTSKAIRRRFMQTKGHRAQ